MQVRIGEPVTCREPGSGVMQVRTSEPVTCRAPGSGVMQVRTVVDQLPAENQVVG